LNGGDSLAHHITGKGRLVGLLGSPIKHSLSPQMHNLAFSHMGLPYAYIAFDANESNLEEIVKAMRALNVVGFNVTMPNKQSIIPLLDEVSPEAEWIGAVNTVHNDNGRLIGYNTDGKGYVQSLIEASIEFKDRKVTILGAGGSCRAIAIQLAIEGVREIEIINRHVSKASDIKNIINKKIPSCLVYANELSDSSLINSLRDSDILINTTSIGMEPNEDTSIIVDPRAFRRDLVVSDIIYKPSRTKLLKMAEASGCRTINGFGMMIWQGALAFKIWTGYDMPTELVKDKFLSSMSTGQ